MSFSRDRILKAVRWVFGVFFIGTGVIHLVLPPGLPGSMSWMYEMSDQLHVVAGVAEILGGAGLIVPWPSSVRARVRALAAAGLALVMIGAAGWHLLRGELASIPPNIVVAGVLAYLAYEKGLLLFVREGLLVGLQTTDSTG